MLKRIAIAGLSILLIQQSCLKADDAPPPFYPITLSGDFIWVQNAPFKTLGVENQHIHYDQVDVAFAYTNPCSDYFGVIFGAGYTGTDLEWAENPFFNETQFGYINLSLGVFTKSFPCWTWTLTGNMLLDTDVLSLSNYTLYQGVLLGNYDLCDCASFKVGFILELGLHKERIWPIFGFEFEPWHNLVLSLVYPLDLSLEYLITEYLSVGTSVRFLRNRHRLRESEPLPLGIFEYHTTGFELDLNYNPKPWFAVSLFGGRTANGDLKITNLNNHDAAHFKFKSAFYGGGSALVSF